LRIMRVRKILAMIVIVADYLKRVEDSALVRLMLSTCLWVLSSMRSQIYDYSTIRSIIMMYYQRANMVAFYYCGEFKFQMNLHSLVTMCAISTALRLCDM
ncbi:hypothetical protein T4C_4097, partial [Trichinella pseudospiralis]